ncbi:MAG TPA: aspartate aminotransferase family protein [Gaiellaceae bacterium]|nr:aspartate aminotransferase family protein [Gaiellaceae bacterium]
MSVEERASAAERVLAARGRYVARGVATPSLVVARAEGARVWDVDGREYLDFAGGIACQNLGHGPSSVVAAIHEQVDRYLHQCFMVGTYEPYVEVCRRLDELWPAVAEGDRNFRPGVDGSPGDGSGRRDTATKSILVNSGAEAIENAVKIARAATGRPGVVVFDRAFHGRTSLTMAMTAKLVYKQGFGPLAADVHRAAAPYPFRGISTEEALASLELLFAQDVDPRSVACMVLEPVQGEGGFIPMPPEFVQALRRICDEHGIVYVDDEVQAGCGRTGTLWAIEQLGVEPDLLVSGKTLGGGLPLAAVTGRTELMDAVHPGGLGGTFGGNPVACAAALAVLDELTAPSFAERSRHVGSLLRAGLEEIAPRQPLVGEARGLGPMLALELRKPTPDAARATTAAAFEKGLLLLACGLDGNVIRLLPPLTASDEELERGLGLLEEALGDAGADRA